MRIYLIRHGSTSGNLEHRYVGTTDEELTADAVQKLRLLRAYYPVPDCVFASPLKRCVQTARILFPELQPELSDGLRECTFGDFEYRNYQELQGNKEYQEWIDSGGNMAFPGGESRAEFTSRCCAAFEACCRRVLAENRDSAAFVVHGGTIMAILDRYSRPHRDYFDWQTENAQGYQGNLVMGQCPEEICIENLVPLLHDAGPVGIEDRYVMKQNRKLRCGYTTGSCAAVAARAASEMLLSGRPCDSVDLLTPGGITLHLPVQGQHICSTYAKCGVRKYGGDDPDATDGLLICARAEFVHEPQDHIQEQEEGRCGDICPGTAEHNDPQILIEGGAGVGRVTKPGLEQPVGAAAINRVPREMIVREAAEACEAYGYSGRIRITISVPGGAETAKRTFNPHIGIEGGISILGTSGIVVPMSEEALLASIRLEMQQKYADGERFLLVTPGNYGEDFIRRGELSRALDAEHSMKCSNYVGETVEMAAELGFSGILFVAHIGKFIKVSGGIMNTHSAQADCRAELIAAQALRAAASRQGKQLRQTADSQPGLCDRDGRPSLRDEESQPELWQDTGISSEMLTLVMRLLAANTTEESVGILREAGILDITVDEIARRIKFHLQKHCQGRIQTEVILYSSQFGYLGESDGAEEMIEEIAEWRNRQKNER